MPYIVITATYPNDKVPDVAKRYLEAIREFPQDDSLGIEIVPAAVKSTQEGMRVITMVEVREGKLQEALKLYVGRNIMFHNIPGYKYSNDIYLKVEEALGAIGMSLPT